MGKRVVLLSCTHTDSKPMWGVIDEIVRMTSKKLYDELKVGFLCPRADDFHECCDKVRAFYRANAKNINVNLLAINIMEFDTLSNDIFNSLKQCDVIHLGGGNTYDFKRKLVQLGLWEKLKMLSGKKVMVGTSAGAIMMGNDIRIASDPLNGFLESGIDTEGLGFVNFSVKPHWDDVVRDSVKGIDASRLARTLKFKEEVDSYVYTISNEAGIIVNENENTVTCYGQAKPLF